jgi:hypothetical protein
MAWEWNLSWRLRLGIVCLAVAYLLVAWLWSEHHQSIMSSAYDCSAIFLILAFVPRRTRLWVAVCLAVAVPFLVRLTLDFSHFSQ